MSYRKGLLRFIFLGVLLLAVSPVQAEEGKELFEKRCVAARGKALFTGERPLARIGPPCAACHRSTMRALPEGTLAKNLGDPADEKVLHDAGLDADGAAALYRLFTVAT